MKLTDKIEKMMSLAQFHVLFVESPTEFRAMGAGWFKEEKALKQGQENAKANAKLVGKWIFAFRQKWESGLKNETAYLGRNLRESMCVFLGIENEKNAMNRAQSCANTMRFVVAGLMTESDYDNNSADAICAGSEIMTKCLDQLFTKEVKEEVDGKEVTKTVVDEEKTHPAILEAARILRDRPDPVAKTLRALKDRIVEQTDGTLALLTEKEFAERENAIDILTAHEMLGKLTKHGHTGTILTEVQAIAKTDKDSLKMMTAHLVALQLALVSVHGPEAVKTAYAAAQREMVNTPAPAPQPAPAPANEPAPAGKS